MSLQIVSRLKAALLVAVGFQLATISALAVVGSSGVLPDYSRPSSWVRPVLVLAMAGWVAGFLWRGARSALATLLAYATAVAVGAISSWTLPPQYQLAWWQTLIAPLLGVAVAVAGSVMRVLRPGTPARAASRAERRHQQRLRR